MNKGKKMKLSLVAPKTTAEKQTKSRLETIEVTQQWINELQLPPFQRPLKDNKKVQEVAEEIKETGVIPGTVVVGVYKETKFIVDGQHRLHAFTVSGLKIGYADVRFFYPNSMAEMAAEFERINSHLVNLSSDDRLRAHEQSNPMLHMIRSQCPFVGYAHIRRTNGPMLSMSQVLRCWAGGAAEVPVHQHVAKALETLDERSTRDLISFLKCLYSAWGEPADSDSLRLYTSLNVLLLAWFYRHAVLRAFSAKTKQFSEQQFTTGLLGLVDPKYTNWLKGRNSADAFRAPAWERFRTIWGRNVEKSLGRKINMPSPFWASNRGR